MRRPASFRQNPAIAVFDVGPLHRGPGNAMGNFLAARILGVRRNQPAPAFASPHCAEGRTAWAEGP